MVKREVLVINILSSNKISVRFWIFLDWIKKKYKIVKVIIKIVIIILRYWKVSILYLKIKNNKKIVSNV